MSARIKADQLLISIIMTAVFASIMPKIFKEGFKGSQLSSFAQFFFFKSLSIYVEKHGRKLEDACEAICLLTLSDFFIVLCNALSMTVSITYIIIFCLRIFLQFQMHKISLCTLYYKILGSIAILVLELLDSTWQGIHFLPLEGRHHYTLLLAVPHQKLGVSAKYIQ